MIRFIDLFCGIGGFRYAMQAAALEAEIEAKCEFSCDIDPHCQSSYEANFGETPYGDISRIRAVDIPSHDILLAGFPCQPFSIIGRMKGFSDTRGTLFFEIARILEAKRPKAFVLENVKLLAGHDGGKTFKTILQALDSLGYRVYPKVLNALDFGLPQKRERIFIVGLSEDLPFAFPRGTTDLLSLDDILEGDVAPKYYASQDIVSKRLSKRARTGETTIWHENKAGNISAHPYSCALRAGASYNYLLVNGERRLTEREMLRLQGFPESFKIVCNYQQTRKQAGNSLPVAVAKAVIASLLQTLTNNTSKEGCETHGTPALKERRETQAALRA